MNKSACIKKVVNRSYAGKSINALIAYNGLGEQTK